ncbi:hypothetical protein ACYCGP_02340 [Stutzerimonas nitrititolerans]|uniref:hypothetical protein n=1 Tax=Stutzerimonas nitrititolerans TaxID=2482751 RepID=UPI0028AD8D61|nr:hypothetical protein [Stutzerimonas nitrititolerans]
MAPATQFGEGIQKGLVRAVEERQGIAEAEPAFVLPVEHCQRFLFYHDPVAARLRASIIEVRQQPMADPVHQALRHGGFAVERQVMGVADVDPDGRTWLVAEYEPLQMAMSVQRADDIGITEQPSQGRTFKQQDPVSTVQYGKGVAFKGKMMKDRHFHYLVSSVCRHFAEHIAAEMTPGGAVIR